MKSIAIIGRAGKGQVNTPIRVESLTELNNNFGKSSNLIVAAKQLLYENISPYIVRIEAVEGLAKTKALDETKEVCMELYADSPGFIGNYTTVNFINKGSSFDLEVYNMGERVEFWGDVTFEKLELINLTSNWIRLNSVKATLPTSGFLSLSTQEKVLIDQSAFLTALKSINCHVEFVLMPDCDDVDVINEALEYCSENNLILLIDPPADYNLFETYNWHKGLSNTEAGVLCWPWVICEFNAVPPSASVAAMLLDWPFPWQPVRSKLSGIDNLTTKLRHDEKAYLSSRKHSINVIGKEGFLLNNKVITLAGSRLSERRLLNYLEAKIIEIGEKLLEAYEPLDTNFRNKFMESCEYILQQTKDVQGISAYYIQINDAVNPEELIVEVTIEKTEGGEIINIGFKFIR